MAVTLTVTLNGNPLRQTYVSHTDFFRFPPTLFFRTDDAGEVTITNAGLANLTGDPSGPTGRITVRVHAQNLVVRVLDGNSPIPFEVTEDFDVSNNGTVDINTAAERVTHFRIMDICRDVYDKVFKEFPPFSRPGRQAFPFGQAATVAETRDRKRIEVVFPDKGPAEVGFVEPSSLGTGFPLIHLKQSFDRQTVAHELGHALYFGLMPDTTRISVEAQYLAWITGRLAAGLPPFHNFDKATTPFVAWIEALGIFSERFYFFSREMGSDLTGVALRQEFFRNELSNEPILANSLDGYQQAGRLQNRRVIPANTGDNIEGALYGAIFLDFARRRGLREAVGRYLNSGDNNVLNFDDFRNLILDETDFDDDIKQVANTWVP